MSEYNQMVNPRYHLTCERFSPTSKFKDEQRESVSSVHDGGVQ